MLSVHLEDEPTYDSTKFNYEVMLKPCIGPCHWCHDVFFGPEWKGSSL